jgi:alpha-beta hydrolase superfamily lysophospholipase
MRVSLYRFLFVFCIAAMLAARGPVFAAGDPALLDRLVRPPFLAAISLSTDGHFLSALKRRGDMSDLVVWHADAGLEAAEVLPYGRDAINWLSWVGGGRLLLSLKEQGLVLYDAHVRRLRPLIDGAGPRPGELPPILLSSLPDDPSRILLQWEDPAVPGFPAVYRVNAVTGESEKIVSAWKPVVRWWASPEGRVQMGEGFNARRHRFFSRRMDGSWMQIRDRDYFDDPAFAVLAMETGGATALVLSSHDGNTRGLGRIGARDGTFIEKLAGHPRFDIVAAILDPETNMAVGASFEEDGIEEMIWAQGHRQRVTDVLRRTEADRLSFTAASSDGRRQLFRQRRANAPPRYYLYDAETDTVHALPTDPQEDSLPRVDTEGVWMRLPRRAGVMHALLSRPAHHVATRGAVVLLHGGPVRRVTDRYSPFVSWLTAGGYTVLQPNFRGSSGFGEAWRRAGYHEWGRVMQDDVRTSVEWLVDQGIAGEKQICVVGGSYGGYAALLSAIRDDDLIACAVSLNGVTSLELLVNYLETRRFHMLTVPRIRGKLSERAMRRRSPLNRADLVRVPVLLLHATNDTNVPFEHGKLMAAMLDHLDKDYNFIVLKDAEHQLLHTRHRRVYFQNTLNFLDAHIGRR